MSHFFPFRQIGDFQITALGDGTMSASLDLLSGIEKADADVIQNDAGLDEPADIHINCYLIRGRGRVILVDAGAGPLSNKGGQLNVNLAAVGISPDEVDTVLLTHCHPDHIGGLLDPEKRPVFQRAQIMLHPLEAQHWLDDKKLSMANERGQRNFGLVRQTLHAYARNLRFFDGDNIAEGILPVWLPGHTPGHTGFRIDADDKCLLIWGDIVHYPYIQSAHPNVSILFDTDPAQAEETRKKIMEKAVSKKMLIAGMHLGQAGFASIFREGSGYRISYSEN
ncbi:MULTISPECIES: MBL fold metallo-hydrolase [Citrobacter]|uniref:MBL fold metallo-hydrolase n=1 Tax=Citrobacter cronae TaxID=1748967 RepID=A0ABS1AA17_9ENTR|nr:MULTISPECIES: MBL fold metallo-hydrolase [Citrobacter]AWS96321.1 MBL fold metallo-hydrolase [Citrobacter sp. CRE-46]MBJ8386716.1 MBL fold metallo-hydrolase [Citrobacter cronae]MBJ8392623.1 MBL fold metallo-hydrolase [Citrobacter cronae]MBX8967308.1 MBL fold metallo-hydrolase [Citrobacter werkmanii]MBX9014807.1 MBL fold metallo-hydrolase [Citrobacter werkmanii]